MKALPRWFIGELFGTFLLVFFGCGSVSAAVLTGAQVGVFQVAIVWGLGIATAIYLTGALSGARTSIVSPVSLVVTAFHEATNSFHPRRGEMTGEVSARSPARASAEGVKASKRSKPRNWMPREPVSPADHADSVCASAISSRAARFLSTARVHQRPWKCQT